MSIILERIDPVPLEADNFSVEFSSWLSVLSDSLNALIQQLEDYINLPYAPSLTTVQITALSSTWNNGTLVYVTDTIPPKLLVKINNVMVQVVTAPYP